MNCTRCNRENRKMLFMSVFNDEQICVDCKEREESHPKYLDALFADREALKNRDYNFTGIGVPSDLVQ